MSKFVYIGGLDDKEIYYSEERCEFYAVDDGFFDAPEEQSFEVPSNYFTPKKLEELAIYRITDERDLRTVGHMYQMVKEYEKRKKLYRVRDKIRDSLYSISPEMRKDIYKYFGTSIIFTLIAILGYIKSEPLRASLTASFEKSVDKFYEENQNDEENLKSFNAAIDANSTISAELKVALKADFKVLVESDTYIPHIIWPKSYRVDGICERITNTDFTNYDESNYTPELAYILFKNRDIISSSIAQQLDECANTREPSDLSIMFGSIYTEDKTHLLTDIFNLGTDEYIDNMAEYYNADKKDIKELVELMTKYNNAENSEEKESALKSFNAKLANILSNYYRDKHNLKDIDKYILASHVYNGEFKYYSNLFSNTLKVTYNDPTYGPYDLYYDTQTHMDVSQTIYFAKLVELIKEKGNNLDYNDPDSRFLFYLTALACDDELYYHYDEVTNTKTPEELARVIYDRVFSVNDGFTNLKPQVLYAYFSNGNISIEDISREMNSPDDNAFSLALYAEYDKCLRIDVLEGKLSEEDYEYRLNWALKWLSKDEEVYNILTDAINNNSSLFSELKLCPFEYNYARDDIKKYIYIPEE